MILSIPIRSGLSVLENELLAEQASSLGFSGRSAEKALADLAEKQFSGSRVEIERLVDVAAQAVWALFVQREICGMSNGQDVIDRYGIPGNVLARLGASPRPRNP
jgi:hypothetical protein